MDFYTHYSREYNQRYYCCEADRIPVSLIMANCNYLKKTNDTLGHEYGDNGVYFRGMCIHAYRW